MVYAKVIATEGICSSGLNAETIFNHCINGTSNENTNGLKPLSTTTWDFLTAQAPEELKKSKATVLASYLLSSLLKKTKWSAAEINDCGFIFASTTAEIDLWEKDFTNINTQTVPSLIELISSHEVIRHQSLGLIHQDLQNYFHINGPMTVVASSCSASSQALALAALWLQSGQVKRCIVGSTEILSELTSTGFDSLRLLSKTTCRPFDKNRNGIHLGEAGAFIALENSNSHNTALANLSGFAMTSDAYHATSPHPAGDGSGRSIQQALKTANLKAEQIDWFYAHGTGSAANDAAEAMAVQNNFSHAPFVSSSKSIHGHTLATSGILESVLCVEALRVQKVIPNTHITETDPHFCINLTEQPKKIDYILKNSLGFGGINCSLIFSRTGLA